MEGPRTVQIKVLDTVPEQILMQEASSNHLMQANNQLIVSQKNSDGTFEEGDGSLRLYLVKQEFKHFRHSLDDTYMLWRSGGANLIVYDIMNKKVDEVIENFWIHESVITKPIAAIASSDANRIAGISLLSKDQSLIHFYQREGQKADLFCQLEKRVLDPTGRLLFKQLCL